MPRRIVRRAEWDAEFGRGRALAGPLGEVVMHTEAGAILPEHWAGLTGLAPPYREIAHIQAVERFHAVNRGWDGIGYSFFIERSGTIFEGRGWLRSGAHTENRNSTAHGVCFAGHGDLQPATAAQWEAASWLIGEGIRLGAVRADPLITGHRNYSQKGKTCPGNLIYPKIGQLRGITGPTEDDDMSAEAERQIAELHEMVARMHHQVVVPGVGLQSVDTKVTQLLDRPTTDPKVAVLNAKLDELLRRPPTDPAALADAIVNALPVSDADALLDALAERLRRGVV